MVRKQLVATFPGNYTARRGDDGSLSIVFDSAKDEDDYGAVTDVPTTVATFFGHDYTAEHDGSDLKVYRVSSGDNNSGGVILDRAKTQDQQHRGMLKAMNERNRRFWDRAMGKTGA